MPGVHLDAEEFQVHEEFGFMIQMMLDEQHPDALAGESSTQLWRFNFSRGELFLP
jgi:hypothetical protein